MKQDLKSLKESIEQKDVDAPAQALEKFHKIGRIFSKVSRVACFISLMSSIGLGILAVTILFFGKYLSDMDVSVSIDSDLLSFLIKTLPLSSHTTLTLIKAATCAFGSLFSFMVFMFMKNACLLFDIMTSEGQPFTRQIARKMHTLIWFAIPLVLWKFWIGLGIIFLLILIASIFDYGVYLQEQHEITNHIQEDVILSFAEITEARSGQTGQHVKRVAEYTYIMARELGFSSDAAENLRYASMMHDVGKISIPLEILEKPGKLTFEEFEIIKTHTSEGERLLHNARGEIMHLSSQVANEHHEKWNGQGYPLQKEGENISLAARIVAVADVFDALTSKRSYKDAWDCQDAYDEIIKCSGTQFDPAVVECFSRCYPQLLEIRKQFAD